MFGTEADPHFYINDIELEDLKEQKYVDPYYFLRRPLEAERLNSIYQQAYIFDLLYRFAKEHLPNVEEIPRKNTLGENEKTTDTTVDSIKDKVLEYLFKNQAEIKEKSETIVDETECHNIWNSDEIAVIRKNLIKIKEENFQLNSQLAVTVEENKNLKEKLEKIKTETKYLPDEIKSLEKTNERLYIRVQDMESRFVTQTAEVEKLENLVKQHGDNEQNLKSKLQELNSEKLRIELENNRLNSKLDSCKNELKSYFMAKCEKYKLKYLKQIRKLEDRLNDTKEQLKREKDQHEKCKKGLDHLRNHFMYAFVPGERCSKINEKDISPL